MTSTRKTETRHRSDGKTCHHFQYHGLTCDDYDALRARANGHCEICGIAEEETRRGVLEVDHCEMQGLHVVRGLLCHYCNNVVMCCLDGGKPWSEASRRWESKAREYADNPWHELTPEVLAAAAARREEREHRKREREQPKVMQVPMKRGVPAMARCLRKWLTPRQVAELARLLAEEPE
jgi:hypothetical protein